jgi:hypothetical protein
MTEGGEMEGANADELEEDDATTQTTMIPMTM